MVRAVGEEIDGCWFAAFDDEVRFVLVGNTEVSQQQYAGVLVTQSAGAISSGGAP